MILSALTNLEDIDLSFTFVTDNGLEKLSGLTSLKSLNIDASQITDRGLSILTSKDLICNKALYLSSSSSLSWWLFFLTYNCTGLTGITHLDLFGACITDSGTNFLLRNLFFLMLHLGLAHFQLIWLIYIPYACLPDFKNLVSLDICGGRITDAGVKNIGNLSSLMILNLSQNLKLTDTALEWISGLLFIINCPVFV